MLPRVIKPMLAVAAPEPFDSEDYFFEIKWDGIRCLAFIDREGVRLQSRQLTDITAQFPELRCLRQVANGTVLDGELVSLANGRPSLLNILCRVQLKDRHRIEILSEYSPVIFMVFDILFACGQSVMSNSFVNRRSQLSEIIDSLNSKSVKMTEVILSRGNDLFAAIQKLGLEGVMAKRLISPYLPGRRSGLWKKIKPAAISQEESKRLVVSPTLRRRFSSHNLRRFSAGPQGGFRT